MTEILKYHWEINGQDFYLVGDSYGLICGNFNRIEKTEEFLTAATGKIIYRIGVSPIN